MKTGELAERAGVNIQTVRFYERERLLRVPPRTASGYRSYSEQDVRHIQFIRECQELGFTLQDIKQLLELHGFFCSAPDPAKQDSRKGERMMKIVQERLTSIDKKIETLTRMRQDLLAAVTESQARHAPVCPAEHRKR